MNAFEILSIISMGFFEFLKVLFIFEPNKNSKNLKPWSEYSEVNNLLIVSFGGRLTLFDLKRKLK